MIPHPERLSSTLQGKVQSLENYILQFNRVALAFSGGTDSAFLLKAVRQLPDLKIIALTCKSPVFPAREGREAGQLCRDLGVQQIEFELDLPALPTFAENPPDRCYHCKYAIFSEMKTIAAESGFPVIIDGSNADDLCDHRPGLKALSELGIHSPLLQAGLTKPEIRLLSEQLQLSTAQKPSQACLASRFAYGQAITPEKLRRVEDAESLLLGAGFSQVRVRVHGDLARLELLPEEMGRLSNSELRTNLFEKMRALNFTYVTVDLGGFQSGSMNRGLVAEEGKCK